MKEQEFDHIIKEKLNAVHDEPPAYMWDRISAGISAQQTAAQVQGLSFGLKILLVASVLAFVIGSVFLFVNRPHKEHRRAHNPFKLPFHHKQIKHRQTNATNDTRRITSSELQTSQKQISENSAPSVTATKANHAVENKNIPEIAQNNVETKQDKISGKENVTPEKSIASNHAAEKQSGQKQLTENSTLAAATLDDVADKEELNTEAELAKPQQAMTEENAPERQQNIEEASEKNTAEATSATLVETAQATTEEIPEEKPESITENSPKESPEESEKENTEPANAKAEAVSQNDITENAPVINDPKSRIRNQYGIGIHYGPEFLNENDLSFTDHGLDLSFNYRNYDFIFQSGLGVRFSKDNVHYNMRYRKWEYLETQIRFDSATFVLDNNGNPVLVPVNPYYEEVYDSVQHTYTATAKEHYTMLQIPLLLGYIYNRGNLSLFVKGGIRYSVVIYQNTTGLFDPGKEANIEQLNYPKKTRVTSNIDYELSLGAGYRIFPKVQVQIEGIGRFYQHSLFDDNPNKNTHPTSLSMRAGLVYIF
jgi:hypothetical protein